MLTYRQMNNNKTKYKNSPLGKIPVDWEMSELKDVCNKITDGTHDTPATTEEGVPFLTAIHVKEDFIDFDNCYFLSEETHKEIYRRCNPEKDDVLMVNIGAGVATTALVNVDYQFSLKNVALLKPNRKKLIGSYLNYFQVFIKPKLTQSLLNGGAQPFLSLKQIQKLKISIPPLPEQKAISHILGLMDSSINKNNSLIAKKELQKKWLMQNLLTGKKRLLNDELGIINDKWKTIKLGDIFEFIKSYSISRDGLTKSTNENLIYCIHYGDIHSFYETDFLDFSDQQSIPQIIDEAQIIYEKDYLKEGDIIMADASEDYKGVGEAIEVLNLEKKTAVGGLHTIVLRDYSGETRSIFRGYLFANESVRNKLRTKATGTSVYSVTKSTLESLTLLLPPVKEQKAIAQVLQAADKEIQLLKTKTEKLREQKKGLMQVLLTGTKRLKI